MTKMIHNRILIIHTQSALNALQGKEALDLSLIFGAFEQPVTVLFLGLGVTQCLSHQNPQLLGQKDYLSTFKLLEMYDIEDTFACQTSLTTLNYTADQLVDAVQPLDSVAIIELKKNAQHIYVI